MENIKTIDATSCSICNNCCLVFKDKRHRSDALCKYCRKNSNVKSICHRNSFNYKYNGLPDIQKICYCRNCMFRRQDFSLIDEPEFRLCLNKYIRKLYKTCDDWDDFTRYYNFKEFNNILTKGFSEDFEDTEFHRILCDMLCKELKRNYKINYKINNKSYYDNLMSIRDDMSDAILHPKPFQVEVLDLTGYLILQREFTIIKQKTKNRKRLNKKLVREMNITICCEDCKWCGDCNSESPLYKHKLKYYCDKCYDYTEHISVNGHYVYLDQFNKSYNPFCK